MKNKKMDGQKYNVIQNIRFALANIWEVDRGYFAAFVPLIPLSVFLPLAGIYFPRLLINLIGAQVSDLHMLTAIAAYCAVLLTAGVINLFCDARISATNYVFSFFYQDKCGDKAMSMDYENLESPKVADMRNHTYAGGMAGEDIAKELNSLLITLLGIFTYGSIIGLLNPFILLLIIVSSGINYLVLTHVRKFTDKNRDKWAHLDRKNMYLYNLSIQYEYAKDIKLYGMRKWFIELTQYYQKLRMEWHDKIFNKNLLQGILDGVLRFVRDGAAYAVLIVMFLNYSIDLGSFVFYFAAIAGFSGWLSSIMGKFNTIFTQSADINRLRAFYEIEDRFNSGEGIPLPQATDIPYDIEFKNLTYYYPGSEKPAVDGINVKINKGERLAIVGVNGAGKTTLIKMLCGLYHPTAGTVILNGRDAREYNIKDYYSQFSAVFQDINLIAAPISHFVASNFEHVDKEKVRAVLKLAGLEEVVDRLENGMDTTLIRGVFDDGVDLSGGEKQKLMLARALYKDAPVMVLDEPTAALDPIAESELYTQYADLTEGKTSIYISHRLSSTRFCDRIIFMKDGKIAECGSHDELMELNGLYAEMFEIQSHYYKEGAINEK